MKVRSLLLTLAAFTAYPTPGLSEIPEYVEPSRTGDPFLVRSDAGSAFRDAPPIESKQPLPKLGKDSMAIDIEALIDGRDHLVIQGGTVQWRHFDWAIVGRHEPLNEPTVISTRKQGSMTLDRVEWFPQWRDLKGNPVSHYRQPAVSTRFKELTPPFPSEDVQVLITPIRYRGAVRIVQQPCAKNDRTLVVEFDDNPYLGAVTYKIRLTVRPDSPKHKEADVRAYFPLDGSLSDQSGNAERAIANGAITFVDGVRGQAASLDGIKDFIEIPNKNLLNSESTVAFWVKVADGGDYCLVSKALFANGYGIWLGRDANFNQGTAASGLPSFGFDGNGAQWNWHMVSADTSIRPNRWHHVAAVLSNSRHTLYIDGKERAANTSADTPSIDAPIWLGREMRFGGGYLNGLLDEVRVYGRALSSDEIGQLYKEHSLADQR